MPQVYVGHRGDRWEAPKRLAGWKKVDRAGASTRVTIAERKCPAAAAPYNVRIEMAFVRSLMPRSTITSKGQVTIPKELRERFGLDAGDVLEFVEDGQGGIHVRVLHEEGALGALRHRAPRKPVSVEAMRTAIRRRARGKARTRP